MSKIVSTDKARQGHWGRHVLLVLIAALLLAAVAWAAAEFYGRAIDPSQPAVSSQLKMPEAARSQAQPVLLLFGSAGTSMLRAFLWISTVVSRASGSRTESAIRFNPASGFSAESSGCLWS